MPHTLTPIRPAINSGLPTHVVAFEVSKHQLVVHTLPADRQCTIPNTLKAVRRVLMAELGRSRLQGLGAMLVVCEATGGYERHVLEAAVQLGIEAHKAHGTKVRYFAKYKGLKAKSDPIDGRVIALYGAQTENLRRYVPPSEGVKAMRALKERRHELQVMLQAETNRLEHVANSKVRASLEASIRAMTRLLEAIETEIDQLLEREETLANKARLMRTVPGVGPVVATTLIAHMPELGTIPRGQAAALAGLVPYDNDSGQKKGRRSIDAGRSAVRRCLYMAALVAMRVCPHLRDFAQRIIARGNPFKVAATAVMRKLIVIINAVLAEQQPCHYAKPA
jgi:transposase